MDLTAKVNALEEEVNLLKGEIKTILQEVRTAVLSQENPFAMSGLDVSPSVATKIESPAASESSAIDSAPSASNVVRIHEASPAPSAESIWAREIANKSAAELAAESRAEANGSSRWSVHSLAALMAWTRESAQRFNATDLGLILALARYGRLIDNDLESTLTSLAEVMAPEAAPPTATSTDFLLALRQLDALLDEANAAADPRSRRAS